MRNESDRSRDAKLQNGALESTDSDGDSAFLTNERRRDADSLAGLDPNSLSLKDGLDPLVEATLANIVEGLRHDWRARMAFYWGDITRICEVLAARDDLSQRVFFLLRDGFCQFSDFLCFFEYFFLQGKYRHLSIDELVAKLEECRNGYLGDVGRSYGFEYVDGAVDAGKDGSNRGNG